MGQAPPNCGISTVGAPCCMQPPRLARMQPPACYATQSGWCNMHALTHSCRSPFQAGRCLSQRRCLQCGQRCADSPATAQQHNAHTARLQMGATMPLWAGACVCMSRTLSSTCMWVCLVKQVWRCWTAERGSPLLRLYQPGQQLSFVPQ